jgi:transposase
MAVLISNDIRSRMMRGMEAGKSAREMSRKYEVAPSSASRLKKHVAETGSIKPRRQGRAKGTGKLGPYRDFLIAKVLEQPDITMPELAAILLKIHDVKVDPSNISKLLCNADFTYKKSASGDGTGARRRKSRAA